MEIIKSMDYCRVITAKKMKGSGLEQGDVVLVTGTKVVPAKKTDPYLQRIYVFVIRVLEGDHQIPSEKNGYKAWLVDPRNLEKLPLEETEQFKDSFEKQYGEP